MSLGHGRRVGPHTLELFSRIGDVPAAADAGAAGCPAGTLLQYSVWMAAQGVPPRLVKNEVT